MKNIGTANEVVEKTEDISKCIDCGRFLEPITDEHKQWYKEHDFSVPRRCPLCIKKKPKLAFESTTKGVGANAIHDAFMKANYVEGSLPEVSSTPVKIKVKVAPAVATPRGESVTLPADGKLRTTELSGDKFSIAHALKNSKIRIEIPTAHTIEELDIEVTHSHDCISCGSTFTMTESDEKWYSDKGWPIPKRCKACRDEKKAGKEVNQTPVVEEKMNEHTCIECNEVFHMSEQHEKWYISKNLLVPNRCPKCVNKRKAEKLAAGQ